MTAPRRPRRAAPHPVEPAAVYGALGDDGVVRLVHPVRRFRVLFVDGGTVDVETAGRLDSVERGLLVAQYGAIAGVSEGVHVGWTGETVDAVLNLPTGSPLSDEIAPPGTNGAGESVASTT